MTKKRGKRRKKRKNRVGGGGGKRGDLKLNNPIVSLIFGKLFIMKGEEFQVLLNNFPPCSKLKYVLL